MQNGFTPLLVSSLKGHVGVVEMLIKNSANIEAAHKVRVRGSVLYGVVVGGEDNDWFVQMMCVIV